MRTCPEICIELKIILNCSRQFYSGARICRLQIKEGPKVTPCRVMIRKSPFNLFGWAFVTRERPAYNNYCGGINSWPSDQS